MTIHIVVGKEREGCKRALAKTCDEPRDETLADSNNIIK
jgi:hypothetical protein